MDILKDFFIARGEFYQTFIDGCSPVFSPAIPEVIKSSTERAFIGAANIWVRWWSLLQTAFLSLSMSRFSGSRILRLWRLADQKPSHILVIDAKRPNNTRPHEISNDRRCSSYQAQLSCLCRTRLDRRGSMRGVKLKYLPHAFHSPKETISRTKYPTPWRKGIFEQREALLLSSKWPLPNGYLRLPSGPESQIAWLSEFASDGKDNFISIRLVAG